MPTQNIYDQVIAKLQTRRLRVRDQIRAQFKTQTPFRMRPLTDKDIIGIYDNMQEQDWYDALNEYGADKVTAFKNKAESLKGGFNA